MVLKVETEVNVFTTQSSIVNDSRHDVNIFTEDRWQVDGERSAGLEARKRLDGVKIEVGKRKVHNLWLFSTKLWAVWGARKDA